MHLLPDHNRVGISSKSAFPQLEWVREPPAPFRAADGALYPLRALAGLNERTPEEQERENQDRTKRRTKWDMMKLMQAALLSVAVQEVELDQESRRYVLHHYRNCRKFRDWGLGKPMRAELETLPSCTRHALANAGIPDVDRLVTLLWAYFRTPRGRTLGALSSLAAPMGPRHAPHAYLYVSPGWADFEELWKELVELGGIEWGSEGSGWDEEELRRASEVQEVKHPWNGRFWRALDPN